jgi:DNA-binding phage protein
MKKSTPTVPRSTTPREESNKSNVNTRVWDPAEHLDSVETIAAYLQAALEEGDAPLISAVLEDIARANGVSLNRQQTGIEDRVMGASPENKPGVPAG